MSSKDGGPATVANIPIVVSKAIPPHIVRLVSKTNAVELDLRTGKFKERER